MKKFLVACATLLAGAAVSFADVTGDWATQEGNEGGFAIVNITNCGDTVCGTIKKIMESDNTSSEGSTIIKDMVDNGDGTFDGGQIWAPDEDKWYKAKMTLDGDNLVVAGCVVVLIDICREQTWIRQ